MSLVIWLFLIIVLGAAFTVVISNGINPLTNVLTQNNESFSIASTRLPSSNDTNNTFQFTLKYAQNNTLQTPISSFVLTNASGAVIANGNYTINLVTGRFNLTNGTYWVSGAGSLFNSTLATYNYKDANYINDPGSNSIFDLFDFLFALGILLTVVAYIYRENLGDLLKTFRN